MAKKKGPLASPFVSAEEQPYPIPENWCWTRLKVLVKASKEKINDFSNGDTKYVGLEHIEKDGGIIGYSSATEVKSLKAIFHVGQILYGKLRPYLNKHDIAGFEGVCSTDILVFDTKNCADSRYVNYFFNQRYFIEYAVSNSKGINLPRVSESIILEAICPLPPLTEQRRIVDRIESLFSKLDEAKEKAQAVVDGFELRKFAILHKAFTGKLTEQWRKTHGVEQNTWEIAQLKDLSSAIGDGLHGTPSYSDFGKYFFINGNNFSGKTILIKPDTKRISCSEYERYKVELNESTVFVSINGTLGKTSFYNNEPVILGKSACYINVNKRLNKYFLRFFLNSKTFIDYANQNATGSTIKNLGLKAIRNLSIYLPSVEEQTEIVCILDAILNKEQKAKEVAEVVLSQIDTMKKAILARAFRGELGTNDSAEEWAGEMVKSKRSNIYEWEQE